MDKRFFYDKNDDLKIMIEVQSPQKVLGIICLPWLCFVPYLMYFYWHVWILVCALPVLALSFGYANAINTCNKIEIYATEIEHYIKRQRLCVFLSFLPLPIYIMFSLHPICWLSYGEVNFWNKILGTHAPDLLESWNITCLVFVFICIAIFLIFITTIVHPFTLLYPLKWMRDCNYPHKKQPEPELTEEQKEQIRIANEKRKELLRFRDEWNSPDILRAKYGDNYEMFNVRFGKVLYSAEKGILRIYDRDFREDQIVSYKEWSEKDVRCSDTYAETKAVPVVTTKSNTASVMGRALVGSMIGGKTGAILGGLSAKRDTVVETKYVTRYRQDRTYFYKYYIDVTVKDSDRPVERINIGENRDAYMCLCSILYGIILNNKYGSQQS